FSPPGKENEGKVWIMVARPMIWLGEEWEELKHEGKKVAPRSIWENDIQKEEKGPAGKPLPMNDKVRQILQALVTDALTNPDLKGTRDSYGTAKDKTFALVDGQSLAWPKQFKPDTPGFKLVEPNLDPFIDQRRILAIRLDKFDLKQKPELQNTPI